MNFEQLHERLRLEIIRRISRGLLTGSLLASQAHLQPSHISNFLKRKRKLSLAALDRVLAALAVTVDDLMPAAGARPTRSTSSAIDDSPDQVPLVSSTAAIHSPAISRSAVMEVVETPAGILEQLTPRPARRRQNWQRFVAVRVDANQATPMSPILRPQSILILDRHYNALAPYRHPQPNVYAVNLSGTLIFRYVSYQAPHIILRPSSLEHPIELLEVGDGAFPTDCIVGRVCLCISQL